MSNINWGRLLAGAVVTAVIYFVADGFIHGKLLGTEHRNAITKVGYALEEDPGSFAYFAAFDLGKGLVVMLLYTAARARFGPGPLTAIWAGAVAWFAIELVPNLANMPFPFYEKATYWRWAALEIVPMILGALAGGWIYREAEG